MSDFIIRAKGLEKTYGGKAKTHALRGVDADIPRGAFCCIVGPSGHGKSTLLQLLGGLDAPTAGCVYIENIDIAKLSDNALSQIRGEKIGFVFQAFNLLEGLSAKENILMSMMFAKKDKKGANVRALELLEMVGLLEKANAKPSELSGGQMQRVAIARALANDAPILLMDEPTGNLDTESEEEVLSHILNVHRAGKTVVIVTHNQEIAGRAEILFEIRDGKLA